MKIFEVSPDTITGSFHKDLIIRKLWLILELSKIKNKFKTIYNLGAWYGNLGIIVSKTNLIKFQKFINIDVNPKKMKTSSKIYKRFRIEEPIKFLVKDANELDYKNLSNQDIVINCSTNNIETTKWFDNIPKGTLVAIQGRNNDSGAKNQYDTLDEFKKSFSFRKILFQGTLNLEDSDTEYDSFLIIGFK